MCCRTILLVFYDFSTRPGDSLAGFLMSKNRGKAAAASMPQKINGIPESIFAILFPRGGATKAPTIPSELARPIAVPP